MVMFTDWSTDFVCCNLYVIRSLKKPIISSLNLPCIYLQDDGHIFCLPDQIAAEIQGVLDMVEFMMGAFGFSKLEINLSTRPAKAVGSDEIWEKAEGALKQALQAKVAFLLPLVMLADTHHCIWLMKF